MHINCLEILAAKTLLKGQTGVSVLLQLDNQTAALAEATDAFRQ